MLICEMENKIIINVKTITTKKSDFGGCKFKLRY